MTRDSQRELILVMGVERSGTNALFDSLATDKSLAAFGEDIDSAFYDSFRLRPVAQWAPLIENINGRILLKPISETRARSLGDVAAEFRAYVVRFVWIYRDPVNVLQSMREQNWVTDAQMAQPDYAVNWRHRNQYALDFCKQSPDRIAIVRYENLCLDAAVFKQLARSLGLDCRSCFRWDTGRGRRIVPLAIQHAIDAETAETIRALDEARTAKPRRRVLLKKRITERLRRWAEPRLSKDRAFDEKAGFAETFSPRQASNLEFWLSAAAICQTNARITGAVNESGPRQLSAPAVDDGPYCFLSLNGRGTIYYPHTKVEQRRTGSAGTLKFRDAWEFILRENGFTLAILFRPNVPFYSPYNQKLATVLRIQSGGGIDLIVQWDERKQAGRAAFVRDGNVERSVSRQPQTHRRQHWGWLIVQYTAGATGRLSISGSGGSDVAASDCELSFVAEKKGSCLELGGDSRDRETLFYGEIAETIILSRVLSADERAGMERYFVETHSL